MVYRGNRAIEQRRRERRGEKRRGEGAGKSRVREAERQRGREAERQRGREKPRNTDVCPMFGTGRKKATRRNIGHKSSTIKVQAPSPRKHRDKSS